MKKYILILVSSIVLLACGNNNADGPEGEGGDTISAKLYNWEAEDTGSIVIKKVEGRGFDSANVSSIIQFMNGKYINVQMQYVKTSGDTIYIAIPEATYLTQQMGSSGPQTYFAEAVYNLTEIPGMYYVNFDFEEGDHAAPAVLDRNSFKDE